MISQIDHINLVVADLDRAVKFYTEVLGMREIQRAQLSGDWIEAIVGIPNVSAEVVFVVAPGGEPRLELLSYRTPEGKKFPENSLPNTHGLRHIAFRVSNIDAAVGKLREHGVQVFSDPVEVPGGIVKHASGRKRLCYFLDPEGVLLELAEYQ